MPLKSLAQMRKLAQLVAQGKFPAAKFHEFARATKNIDKLPERKRKKK